MDYKVCFIGHRNFDKYKRLERAIQNQINRGTKYFMVGTHGKFDEYALYFCKKFKKEHNDIEIEVVITSLNQIKKKILYDDQWGRECINSYSDMKTVIYDIEDEHFKNRITSSNKQMIDCCDILVCYVNPKKRNSGAKTAMNYAKRKGKRIINLFSTKDDPTFYFNKQQKIEYFEKLFSHFVQNS